MRILAVDYGLARIGLALSDPTGFLARELTVLKRQNDELAAEQIAMLAREHEVDEIIVGLPIHMNGSRGEKAVRCEEFARLIEGQLSLPVVLVDERLTTVQAEKLLIASDMRRDKRKKVIDAVAATLLLQSYLDSRR